MVRGEPNEMFELDLRNAFKDFYAHYLAPFLVCACVAPREKMAWSLREKDPEPDGNYS